MREFTREEIYEKLKNGVVDIYFKKKDGTSRMMTATWNEAFIPDHNENKKAKDESEKVAQENAKPKDYCAVWDITVKDWRSFRFESIYRIDGDQVVYGNK